MEQLFNKEPDDNPIVGRISEKLGIDAAEIERLITCCDPTEMRTLPIQFRLPITLPFASGEQIYDAMQVLVSAGLLPLDQVDLVATSVTESTVDAWAVAVAKQMAKENQQ